VLANCDLDCVFWGAGHLVELCETQSAENDSVSNRCAGARNKSVRFGIRKGSRLGTGEVAERVGGVLSELVSAATCDASSFAIGVAEQRDVKEIRRQSEYSVCVVYTSATERMTAQAYVTVAMRTAPAELAFELDES
jgi:hypothetical protein